MASKRELVDTGKGRKQPAGDRRKKAKKTAASGQRDRGDRRKSAASAKTPRKTPQRRTGKAARATGGAAKAQRRKAAGASRPSAGSTNSTKKRTGGAQAAKARGSTRSEARSRPKGRRQPQKAAFSTRKPRPSARGKRQSAGSGAMLATLGTAAQRGWKAMRDGAAKLVSGTAADAPGDALELLTRQHREVETLFKKIARLAEGEQIAKRQLFQKLDEALTVHAAIEEQHFYPAVRAAETQELVAESFEEHATIKRQLAELRSLSPSALTFDDRIEDLEESVEHHAKEEEESKLFPKVRKLLDERQLEALGSQMRATMGKLKSAENDTEVRAAPFVAIEGQRS